MYKISDNPQVNYSLRELSKGLFHFLKTMPLSKVTVSQLCAQAGITRRTFYRNCREKKDLVLYACDDLIDSLLDSSDLFSTNAELMYSHFFEFWYGHRAFLSAVCGNDLAGLFVGRFVSHVNDRMRFPLQEKAAEKAEDAGRLRRFSNAFLLGGFAQMLISWTQEGFETPPRKMAETILYLVPNV